MSTESLGKLELTKFIWEINANVFKNINAGEKIESLMFSSALSKNLWQLELYPRGINSAEVNPAKSDYLALYLKHLNDTSITVDYSFSVLNQDGVKVDKFQIDFGFFNGDSTYEGTSEFVEKSFIMDSKNNVLKDNKFKILCKIVMYYNEDDDLKESLFKFNKRKLHMFDEFEKLFNDKEYSDVTVVTANKIIYLNKCILTLYSPVFEAMFRNDMEERNKNTVEIKDIKDDVLEEFFRFMYTGDAQVFNIECELLTAAEKYCFTHLKEFCEHSMASLLHKANAIDYLKSAMMNNAMALKAFIIKWMSLHLDCLSRDSKFMEFGKQHPEVLLEIMQQSSSS